MTCSFHKFGEYFPGTGTQEDKGKGKGKGYAVNVPLKDGITDEAFKSVFEPVSFLCPMFKSERTFYFFRLLLGFLMYINLRRLYCNAAQIHWQETSWVVSI
jgi:hypothetical protein